MTSNQALLACEVADILSTTFSGPNTNTAHFSITVAPAHHLDGSYVSGQAPAPPSAAILTRLVQRS